MILARLPVSRDGEGLCQSIECVASAIADVRALHRRPMSSG